MPKISNKLCLNWKNEEYFELGEGRFFKNEYLSDDEVKIWNCTREWEDYLNIEIIEFKVNYIDVAQLILSSFELKFKNNKIVTIIIGKELNLGGTIPIPLEFDFSGEIYVFFNQELYENVTR